MHRSFGQTATPSERVVEAGLGGEEGELVCILSLQGSSVNFIPMPGKRLQFFYLILACVHSHMFHLYSFFLDLINQFKSWLFFMLLMRLNQLINPLCIPLFDGQNPWFLGEICWDALLVTLTLTSLVAIPLHFLWMRTGRQGGVGYTWKISP